MKRHTAHSERMRCIHCECGSDRSVIKGTLLGEHYTLWAVLRLSFVGFREYS
jgi:hypothetical protein